MRLTGSIGEPELAFLPWDVPLEEWPDDLVVALPRGISRHIVRFVRINGVVYAIKEVEERYAQREYELLFDLVRRGLPTVEPFGVVLDRASADGEPLPAGLITKHLEFSLPYRALFSSSLRPETANRLLDALTVLLVQLHLAGFSWNDCSLSNTLFRRDAGAFAAYLVDAETGELHPTLSTGQRTYDLETAATNVAGELMDLQAGGRLHEGIDPIVTGVSLRTRYDRLWDELTGPIVISREDRYQLEGRVRRLNTLGFDVAELQVHTQDDGEHITVTPKVVDAGHHSRRLIRLTGLDVEENQARRLLNDLDSFRIKIGLGARGRGDRRPPLGHRALRARDVRGAAGDARQARAGADLPRGARAPLVHVGASRRQRAVRGRDHRLRAPRSWSKKPDEQAVLGSRVGTPSDDTAELRIVLPPADRPVTGEFASLLVIATIAAFVPLLVGLLRIKVAEVVLLLGAGVLFGPQVLGLIEVDDSIALLSDLGLGMLFFLAGLELEALAVRGQSGRLAAIGWGTSLVLAGIAAVVLEAARRHHRRARRRHRADLDGPRARCCPSCATAASSAPGSAPSSWAPARGGSSDRSSPSRSCSAPSPPSWPCSAWPASPSLAMRARRGCRRGSPATASDPILETRPSHQFADRAALHDAAADRAAGPRRTVRSRRRARRLHRRHHRAAVLAPRRASRRFR